MARHDIEHAIQSALRTVRVPGGPDLIEAGAVAEVSASETALKVVLRGSDWPEPIRRRVTGEVQAALMEQIDGLERVDVDFQASQSTTSPAAPALSIAHVIAVGSGKGGVGKSTIAASIAFALQLRGHAVGLMDADVYGPSLPMMLGLSGQPEIANNRYVPLVSEGVKCMSMGFLIPADQAVVWRGPMLHKAVRDFLFLVDWGPLDYLIVDLPPGTGDVALSLAQTIPLTGGVIVCTPQDVALLDAKKALNMFETVKIPCCGIVENMSFFICPHCSGRTEIFGHGGARQWAEQARIPFLGSVPINLDVRIHSDTGRVRDNFLPTSPVREHLIAIADRLAEGVTRTAPPRTPKLEVVT